VAAKDLKVMWRDRVAVFFYYGFPVLYAILVGYLMSGIVGIGVGLYRGTVTVTVVDSDRTEASAAYIERLDKTPELKIHIVDLETAKDTMRRRKCAAYLILKPGFAETGWQLAVGDQPDMQLVTDESRPAEAQIARGLVYMQLVEHIREYHLGHLVGDPQQNARLRTLCRVYLQADTEISAIRKAQLLDVLSAWEEMDRRGRGRDSTAMVNPWLMGENAEFRNASLLRDVLPITFPQGVIWAMLFSTAFFAQSLVEERSGGTMPRLRMAPLTRLQLLAGKGLACLLNCLIASLLLLAVGITFFKIQPDSYLLLLLSLSSAALCFSGMMMLFACCGKTSAAVTGISLAALIVMALLGGAGVPEVVMPPPARAIADYVPVKWAIMAVEGPIRRDFSLAELAPYYLKLMLLGAASYLAGVWVLRRTEK
jgi:ABC-2 type transport system permease protein